MLDGRHYSKWPTERRTIEQRYSDVAPSSLTVPTIESFAGWKTAAWHDRGAARDPLRPVGTRRANALTTEAAELFAQHGTTGSPPRSFMFDRAPSEAAWEAQLAGQTRLVVTAGKALEAVRRAWANALGESWDD